MKWRLSLNTAVLNIKITEVGSKDERKLVELEGFGIVFGGGISEPGVGVTGLDVLLLDDAARFEADDTDGIPVDFRELGAGNRLPIEGMPLGFFIPDFGLFGSMVTI